VLWPKDLPRRIATRTASADRPTTGRRPLSDELVSKIKAMHADQRRPTDISRMLKVGRTSVYRALKGEQSE
jgi:hypothetical protein